jgi:lipid-binding SYLF domain-containing protein
MERTKALLCALLLVPAGAMAGNEKDEQSTELSEPQADVQEAAAVLDQMRTEAEDLGARLAEAKGVFVIPDYATAALLVGGSGGEGVLLQRRDGELTDPAFYDVGSVDIGAQAGASAGAIVLMLMNDEALSTFQQETNFALTSQAGLTIVNWSADTGASSEPGDVLVWSDTEGLMAEASVGVSGISWDEEENRQYYNSEVTAEQVLAGDVENPHEESLRSEFAEFSAQ